MNNKQTYTILLLLNAQPTWLALSRKERNDFFASSISKLFDKYKACRIRLFDCEYFHGSVSDFMMIETEDLRQYQFLIEELRDTEIYSVPYFNVKDIILAKENGFKDFEETAP